MSNDQDKSGGAKALEPNGVAGDRFRKDKYDALRRAAVDGKLPDRTDLSFQDRLKFAHLRLFHEIDDERRIEEVIGRSEKQIARYTSGSDMPISVLLKIAEWSRVPLDWILENELKTINIYAIKRPTLPNEGGQVFPVNAEDFSFVPRYDVRASAGPGAIVAFDDINGSSQFVAFRTEWLHRIGINPRRAEALIAVGDSMEPTIRSGDLLLIDRSLNEFKDEGIYVIVLAGRVLVKRIQLRRDGSAVLRSDNTELYEDEVVPAHDLGDLRIEGRVMWFGRTI
ncbi:S24 family peptidase [Xanthobacteraceae bacterium Astr-EGSB]|uniref:S24 family peptidase n=1 Tax=Astrobacterium formosum TaxID=3069710 RepID=UPI0027B04209|nr:S24 family peptidase [Xanthobacteraceae bacterium Astr-EGSB]